MTIEDKLLLLPELLELVDGSDVQHTESEPKVKGGLKLKKETVEDFGSTVGEMCAPTACT